MNTYDFGPVHGIWIKEKFLSRGSFGEVFLVSQQQQQQQSNSNNNLLPTNNTSSTKSKHYAVVKLIDLSTMKESEKKSAKIEVDIMAKVKHPNIVQYFSSFVKSNTLHILMEYADQGDLASRFLDKKKELSEKLIGRIFVQLASAIHYLHGQKILHRDLKCANILLTRSRNENNNAVSSDEKHDIDPMNLIVKVCDLGVACVLRHTHALSRTTCGTPYYFSPEMVLSKPYSNKTDIWSLGVILYELVTMRRCFDAKNLKALMQRILQSTYLPIDTKKYSLPLSQLIDNMLQQKVEKRFSIRQVVSHEFFRRHLTYMHSSATSSNSGENNNNNNRHHESTTSIPIRAQVVSSSSSNQRKNIGHHQNLQQQKKYSNYQDYKNKAGGLAAQGKIEPMKYIKRRQEMVMYDHQQDYVDRGRQVIERARAVQEERQKVHDGRSSKINDLRKKLQQIEERHTALKFEREYRKREEAEIMQYYQQQQQEILDQQQQQNQNNFNDESLIPRHEVSPSDMAKYYRNRNYRGMHQQSDMKTKLQVKGARLTPNSVRVDDKFAGRRELENFDVDQLLEAAKAKAASSSSPMDNNNNNNNNNKSQEQEEARKLWQDQKQRIEEARRKMENDDEDEENDENDNDEEDEENDEEDYYFSDEEEQEQSIEGLELFNAEWNPEEEEQKQRQQQHKSTNDNNPHQDFLLFNQDFTYDNENNNSNENNNNNNTNENDDYFEDEPAPSNIIDKAAKLHQRKFRLDGKTISGSAGNIVNDMSSPIHARVLALKEFLISALGGIEKRFDEIYLKLREIEIEPEIDIAEEKMLKLEQSLGEKDVRLLDLFVQLRACEVEDGVKVK